VVGYAYRADGNFRAFLYSGGALQDLGTLGGDWSTASAINAGGQIVGQAYTPHNLEAHAFVMKATGGTMMDLGTLGGGPYSSALAINSSDEIVGQSTLKNNSQHAFVYADGKMQDLNSLIPVDQAGFCRRQMGLTIAAKSWGTGLSMGRPTGSC
jgi:probable HAF family extracellular repeat protein